MRIVCANCDHCGAPLEIPFKAKRVTCLYCDASLEVVRTDSTISTTVLEQIDRRMSGLETEVERMKLRDRLRAIDENWRDYRKRFVKPDGTGGVPTRGAAQALLTFSVILLGTGGLALFIGSVFGLGILLVGSVLSLLGMFNMSQASEFDAQRRHYRIRRQNVLRELDGLREDAPA